MPTTVRAATQRIVHDRPLPRFFAVSFTALLSLMTLWALASPPLSAPDEPSHIIRAAAAVRGQFVGEPRQAVTDYNVLSVPGYIAPPDALCFAGDPSKSAECQLGSWPAEQGIVEKVSSASSNNPIYYLLVGAPTLVLTDEPALFGVRFLSAVLVSFLLATALTAIRAQSATSLPVLVTAIAITPSVLFLGGTTNPNAVEMAGAAALLASGILVFRQDLEAHQARIWSAAAAASGVLLLSGRSLALLWLLIIFVIIVIVVGWRTFWRTLRRRSVWVAVAAIGLAALWMLVWTRLTVAAVIPLDGIAELTPGTVLVQQFEQSVTGLDNWIGAFGWLDTHAPNWVLLVWHVAIGAPVIAALGAGSWRNRSAMSVALGSILLVPPIVQVVLYPSVGWMWQGRYILAIYLSLMIVAALVLDRAPVRNGVIAISAVLLALAHLATFADVLRRYVVGANENWVEAVLRPEWQPPGSWIALTSLYAIVLGAVTALVIREAALRVTPPQAIL